MNITPKRGLRSFYPADKSPIDSYQLGHEGRIEYVAAVIESVHLTKGIATTEEWRKWARERGIGTDEPGLIVSQRLGGSGIDSVNLFPKSPNLDKTSWARDEEKAYREAEGMQKWKKLKFFAKFQYPSENSLRPSDIEYQYVLPSGIVLHAKVPNNVLEETSETLLKEVKEVKVEETKIEDGAKQEEDLEGSGSEYEYEYEDELEAKLESLEDTTSTSKVEPAVQEPIRPEEKVVEKSFVRTQKPEVVELLPKSPKVSVQSSPPPTEEVKKDKITPIHKITPAPLPPMEKLKPKAVDMIPPEPELPEPDAKAEIIAALEISESKPIEIDDIKVNTETAHRPSSLKIFSKSDVFDFLPILGSLKLGIELVKAAQDKDVGLSLLKGIQCGISVFADFHLIKAFTTNGEILYPISDKTLLQFATNSQPYFLLFGSCKVGNEVVTWSARAIQKKS